jgi:hypothetical protein
VEQKLESLRKKTQNILEKWSPNIAVVNRSTNHFNGNVRQHFRTIKKRQKQMKLDKVLSKEKSSGANINGPQLSTSGFPMIEG